MKESDRDNNTKGNEMQKTYESPTSFETYRVEYTVEVGYDGSEKMVGAIKGNSANEVRAKLREQWGCELLSIEAVRPIKL